ncbi:MAG: hypothetical protein E6X17_07540 [Sporomusaceae bacterium]|nr:hypothetical protein [Sporomusaceae bacterium]
MKRILIFHLLIIVLLFISGCAQVEHDIIFNDDFSGKCTSKVLFFMPITQEEFQKMLDEKGVKNVKVTPYKEEITDGNANKTLNGYLVITSWNTLDEFQTYYKSFSPELKNLSPMKKNDDGSVSVDFGINNVHSIKMRVDGTIKADSTKGKISTPSTVEFINGEQIAFTYQPSSNNTGIIAIALVLLMAIVITLYMKYRKSGCSA